MSRSIIQIAAWLARGTALNGIDIERWYKTTPQDERRRIIRAVEAIDDDLRQAAQDLRIAHDAQAQEIARLTRIVHDSERECAVRGQRVVDVTFAHDKLSQENAALRARLAECERDAERFRFIAVDADGAPFCDQFGDVDLHEQAAIYASARGNEEADRDDYLAAARDAIDAARGGV